MKGGDGIKYYVPATYVPVTDAPAEARSVWDADGAQDTVDLAAG